MVNNPKWLFKSSLVDFEEVLAGLWDRSRIFATNCSITRGYYHAILRCFLPATTSVMVRNDSKPILRTITLPSRKKCIIHHSSLSSITLKMAEFIPLMHRKSAIAVDIPSIHSSTAPWLPGLRKFHGANGKGTHTHMRVSINGTSPKWMFFWGKIWLWMM